MAEVIEVEVEAGRMTKNAVSEIVARLTRVRGTPCADVRIFAVNAAGEVVPTKAGICIARERLPALRDLVDKLLAACGQEAGGGESEVKQ